MEEKAENKDKMVETAEIEEIDGLREIWFNTKGKGNFDEWMVARNLSKNMLITKREDDTYLLIVIPEIGSNIILEAQDLTQLEEMMKKIQLNIEKGKILKKPELEISAPKRVRIADKKTVDKYILAKMEELVKEICDAIGAKIGETLDEKEFFDVEFTEFWGAIYDWLRETGTSMGEINEIWEVVRDYKERFRILENNLNSYALTTIDGLKMNGEMLEDSDKVVEFLIENARSDEFNGAIDLNQYPEEIQGYLLRATYDRNIELEKNQKDQKEAIDYYKGKGFTNINSFLRGEFDGVEINDFIKTIDAIMKIIEIFKTIPTRKYDLVITRIGIEGKNSKNSYDSFVSFGTDNGTSLGKNTESRCLYKRVLKADDRGIPLDLVCSREILVEIVNENEILMLPFSFEEQSATENKEGKKVYRMSNVKEIKIEEILITRLREFSKQHPELESEINGRIELLKEMMLKDSRSKGILDGLIQCSTERFGLSQIKSFVQSVMSKIKRKDFETLTPIDLGGTRKNV